MSARVHHLNCVSACPLGGLLMDGFSGTGLRGRLATHCLLVELGDTLVLVDTGYGLRDVANPRSRLSEFFLALVKPELREEMTAVRQIARLGYEFVRELESLGPDLLMVPLIGHTLGHAGFAVRRDSGWLFCAADAYFYHAELSGGRPYCTPGLRLYQTMMEKNRALRLHNRDRLRALRTRLSDIEIFCAHDVVEFERSSGRSFRDPLPFAPESPREASKREPDDFPSTVPHP